MLWNQEETCRTLWKVLERLGSVQTRLDRSRRDWKILERARYGWKDLDLARGFWRVDNIMITSG